MIKYGTTARVSPEVISCLSDDDLADLMRHLLRAEVALCGLGPGTSIVGGDPTAKDDGEDGRTPPHQGVATWLPPTDTCWQFKAGVQGQPGKIGKEIKKPRPRATLKSGGSFVLVATGSTNGDTGETKRRDALKKAAKALKLAIGRIRVIGSERLAEWVSSRPAVAHFLLKTSDAGFIDIDAWEAEVAHKHAYKINGPSDEMNKLRDLLSVARSDRAHVHIEGLEGVGKTRYALELCRVAPWRAHVLYWDHPAHDSIADLFSRAQTEKDIRLVAVIDECETDDVQRLRTKADRADGRIRLITVGKAVDDVADVIKIRLKTLDQRAVEEFVASIYTDMNVERVQFCAELAGGYIKLARVIAQEVQRQPSIDVHTLLKQDNIERMLTDLIIPDSQTKQALTVVAVLAQVGWTEDLEEEGRAISKHFGLAWSDVRQLVSNADREKGIAPLAGRLRYISPRPLAQYLATAAWEERTDVMIALFNALPTQRSKDAFLERLRSLFQASPRARAFFEGVLPTILELGSLRDPWSAKVWSVVSGANPLLAVQNLRRALEQASIMERQEIAGEARREIVWALERFAWPSASFADATFCLAELAVAENETYANNATSEFVGKFSIHLGGTSVPYPRRLEIIDQLVARNDIKYLKLVVAALAKVGSFHEMRMGGALRDSVGVPEPEWTPASQAEEDGIRATSLERLGLLAAMALPELKADMLDALKQGFWPLWSQGFHGEMAALMRAMANAYPESREELRRIIANTEELLDRHEGDLAKQTGLNALHDELRDKSVSGRLSEHVGHPPFVTKGPTAEMQSLAAELVKDTALSAQHVPWLTSGEARGAWDFGAALADADTGEALLLTLLEQQNRGPDLRIVTSYLKHRASHHDGDWLDDLLDERQRPPQPDHLLVLDATWRATTSARGAARVLVALREGSVPPTMFGAFALGSWGNQLPLNSFAQVAREFSKLPELRGTALSLVESRIRNSPADTGQLSDLCLDLASDAALIKARDDIAFHWKGVAKAALAQGAKQIADAIFRAQHPHDGWFIQHSDAKGVLQDCTKADPAGVWEMLRPHLESDYTAHFLIGFPTGVVEELPHDLLLTWAGQDAMRARTLVKLAITNYADTALFAKLIDRFSNVQEVQSAAFGTLVSGSAVVSLADLWAQRAEMMQKVVMTSGLEGVRKFAKSAIQSLREMERRDRQREAERDLSG